jgi:hypothetical protein
MSEISVRTDPEEEWKPPPYGKPGRILVQVTDIGDPYLKPEFEYEILDYDSDTSVFWLNEGGMFDYTFDTQGLFIREGRFLIERAVGTYYRGDGWTTDDDESWEFSKPVPTDMDALPDPEEFTPL